MNFKIESVVPVQPNEVGDNDFEFRVKLQIQQRDFTVDITAQQLTDFRQFQQVVLSLTGRLADFGFDQCGDEFSAWQSWQKTLLACDWSEDVVPLYRKDSSEVSGEHDSDTGFKFLDE